MKMAAALLTVFLVSCGGSGGKGTTETAASCSSFAGQPVTADTFANLCTVDEATADQLDLPIGEMFLPSTAWTLCEDNRVLIWNDLGWGYEGQPFTAFVDVVGERVAPRVEREGCAAT